MRSPNVARILPFLVAAAGLVGCAAPTADDGADEQTQDVTGGSSSIESPVAFLFESAAANAAPTCAGAMLADKFAVTAKSCAKEGLLLGRAADKDGKGTRAKVIKVHTPPGADADIAVVELDRAIKGTHALITHMPLRGGYAVNAFAATDGKGLFTPDKNEASSITATMIDETATHGSIVPAKGSEICVGDIGAPVCSSVGGKIAGYNLYGTCGLSGLVVARADVAAADPAADPAAADAAKPCSGGAWKVTQLGQHAAFLKTFAPKAFQPWFIDKPIVRNYPYYTPEGLWGYKTKGEVTACTVDAQKLVDTKPGAASAKMNATVAFAGMEKNAAAWGRFGIAPKSAPTKMRWLPAQKLGNAKGAAFATSFEGVVSAAAAGDYVVAFRASANGGETWTTCDTDGIENGFDPDQALSLKVVDPSAPSTTPTETPAEPPPSSPSSSEGTYSDPPATEGESESDPGEEYMADPDDEVTPKKEASDNQGCSMSTSSPLGTSSSLPIAGVLLGLAAVMRRRRR